MKGAAASWPTVSVSAAARAARVLLDLRDLNFMDRAGIELLDRTYVESSLEGWTFAVITTGERYLARAA